METRRLTVTDRLEAYFRASPGVWIDGMEIAKVAGCYGWRTRCSDLRKRGMVIENRQTHQADAYGQRYTKSLYMFIPAPTAAPREPHNLNQPWGLR